MSHFIKRTVQTVCVSYIVPSTETHFFSGEGGGRLLQILSLRRDANSKQGAYLKLGANLSINSNRFVLCFLKKFLESLKKVL